MVVILSGYPVVLSCLSVFLSLYTSVDQVTMVLLWYPFPICEVIHQNPFAKDVRFFLNLGICVH